MKPGLAFIASLFIIISCTPGEEDSVTSATYNYEQESEPLTYVDALTASKSILIPEITASGVVRGIHETLVLSETQGAIKKVFFEIGDILDQGAILLQVDDTIPSYNKDQAKLALETAELDLEAAKKFYNSGSTSLIDVKKTENIYNTRKVQYEQAVRRWKDCTVRSPISGVVAEKNASITKGAYLSPGSPIARIVDTSYYTLTISVGERQIGLIKEGQQALVSIPAAVNGNIKGRVTAVAGGSDQQTGSFSVVISWENNGGVNVKSGMSAYTKINVASDNQKIIIPFFAMLWRDDGAYVYMAVDGKATLTKIIPGSQFGERVEITDGLEEGDLVIITRIQTLVPGTPVSVRTVGKTGEWR
jgi:membrane fusion protein, multidrug efflux system